MSINLEGRKTFSEKLHKFFKGLITVRKKRIIPVLLLEIVFLFAAVFLPKELGKDGQVLFRFFLLDQVLLLGLVFRIRISEKWRGYLSFLMFVTAPVFCFWEIEYVNESTVLGKELVIFLLTYLIMITVFLFLHVFINKACVSIAVGVVLFTFYGLLYSFVMEFRGNGLRASDLYAVQTAANVAEGYVLRFTPERVTVMLAALTFVLVSFYVSYRHKRRERLLSGTLTLVCAIVLSSLFSSGEFVEKYSIKPYLWELAQSKEDHGAFLDFAAGLPYLRVEKPEGYSAKNADALLAEGSKGGVLSSGGLTVERKEAVTKPHVIVVMNESFADFRQMGDLETDKPVLENWDSMEENVIKGFVSIPIFGGWTPNSEFEFLTGFSNAFFPSGSIPYQNYVKKGTPSMNDTMKELDYTSVFMHPQSSSGWNRKAVYEMLGFDETYYIEDFDGYDSLRGMISDKGNYDKIIQVFEEKKEKDEHLFLFNVTMQNHGGYSQSNWEDPVQITSPKGSYPQAAEYLNLIRESDRAWKELVDYFSQEQEPVVLCMFGDHYPKVEESFYEELMESSGVSGAEEAALKYQVPFMIYTNYDIEEKEYENISLNYLSSLVCETAGLPLSEYQKYLENLYEEFPVVNVYGVKDKSGNWHTWDEAMQNRELQEYEKVQYRMLFDN